MSNNRLQRYTFFEYLKYFSKRNILLISVSSIYISILIYTCVYIVICEIQQRSCQFVPITFVNYQLSIVNSQLKDYPFNLCQTFRQLVAYLFDFFKICKISVA